MGRRKENSLTINEEKRMYANQYKDQIIEMYDNGMSATDISKKLGIKRLTHVTITEYLKDWGISIRPFNNLHFADRYVNHTAAYDEKTNELIKVFKYKWQLRRWLNKIGAVEAEFSCNHINDYIRRRRILAGMYFKSIDEELYNKYKDYE